MSRLHHVVTFDHERAASTLFDDLRSLGVRGIGMSIHERSGKSDGARVWVRVPDDTDPDAHLTAVKNISLGRGSHEVAREDWSDSETALETLRHRLL